MFLSAYTPETIAQQIDTVRTHARTHGRRDATFSSCRV